MNTRSAIDPAMPKADSPPWYQPVADEVELFEAAWAARVPMLLEGPTGCGKTRFVEYMASRVTGSLASSTESVAARMRPAGVPLLTVSCHEDLSANDLVGRHLLLHDRTVWHDGPMTRAVREGAILYLDEIVEARRDTTVVIHSLCDHRRILPIEKTGEQLRAHPDFLLVVSYNPGHQSVLKDLKPSTRQRFVCLRFDYPGVDVEARIVAHESGVDNTQARQLALIGERLRVLADRAFGDGVSTRALIHAGQLIVRGIAPRRACEVALAGMLADEPDVRAAAQDVIDVILP